MLEMKQVVTGYGKLTVVDRLDLVSPRSGWDDARMASSSLANLLKLPAGERAELAMALWDSLSDRERGCFPA